MPNWCNNTLTICGSREMLEEIIEGSKCGLFNFVRPEPGNADDNNYDWFDWRNSHWGTKWDIDDTTWNNSGSSIQMNFDTAWGPPIMLIQYGSSRWPESTWELMYQEHGMCFAGGAIAYKGWCVDECLEDPMEHLIKWNDGYGVDDAEELDHLCNLIFDAASFASLIIAKRKLFSSKRTLITLEALDRLHNALQNRDSIIYEAIFGNSDIAIDQGDNIPIKDQPPAPFYPPKAR